MTREAWAERRGKRRVRNTGYIEGKQTWAWDKVIKIDEPFINVNTRTQQATVYFDIILPEGNKIRLERDLPKRTKEVEGRIFFWKVNVTEPCDPSDYWELAKTDEEIKELVGSIQENHKVATRQFKSQFKSQKR